MAHIQSSKKSFQRPQSIALFHFKHFQTKLHLKLKSLEITISPEAYESTKNLKDKIQCLNELHEILNWCKTHVEVKTLVLKETYRTLTSQESSIPVSFFSITPLENCKNIKGHELPTSTFQNELTSYFTSIHELTQKIATLPQLTVYYGVSHLQNYALDIMSSFNLVFATSQTIFEINHFELGFPVTRQLLSSIPQKIFFQLAYATTKFENQFSNYFPIQILKMDDFHSEKKLQHIIEKNHNASALCRFAALNFYQNENLENSKMYEADCTKIIKEENHLENLTGNILNSPHEYKNLFEYVYPQAQALKVMDGANFNS